MRLLLVKEANLYFLFLTSASNKCHAPHRRRNRGKGGAGGQGATLQCTLHSALTKMEMVPTPMLQTGWAQGYKYSSTCLFSPHCMSLE